jgi:hypothetical protein
VNISSRVSQSPAHLQPDAAGLLGSNHPLVRDLRRVSIVLNQSLVVAAVFAGAVGALLTGSSHALAVVAAATGAEILLACRLALLLGSRRAHILDLIRDGHGDLPIAEVERMCQRLRRPSHRQRLVEAIEALLSPEAGSFKAVTSPWQLAHNDVVRSAREELRAITHVLREADADVRGTALLEQMLFDGTSALHGDHAGLVREELRRARFLLGVRSGER